MLVLTNAQQALLIPIVSSNFSRHVDSTATQREYPELETAISIKYTCLLSDVSVRKDSQAKKASAVF